MIEITPGHYAWPLGFDRLPDPPERLFVNGQLDVLAGLNGRQPGVAVVGSRAATGYGEHLAMELSTGLVSRGFTVVSGGAYGIDGMAHRAAIAGDGKTIAFMAGGLDRYYPTGHEEMLHRIAVEGAVVSEYPPGQAPTRYAFLARNRLIAAASAAVVVVEAGARSGSINTAGHANRMSVPLYAFPGLITSAASVGTNQLIRDGKARLITSAADIETGA